MLATPTRNSIKERGEWQRSELGRGRNVLGNKTPRCWWRRYWRMSQMRFGVRIITTAANVFLYMWHWACYEIVYYYFFFFSSVALNSSSPSPTPSEPSDRLIGLKGGINICNEVAEPFWSAVWFQSIELRHYQVVHDTAMAATVKTTFSLPMQHGPRLPMSTCRNCKRVLMYSWHSSEIPYS